MKDNQLIAEFIGANRVGSEYEMYGVIESIDDGEDERHFFLPSEMEFQDSWDWLMPVVEKIEDLGYVVEIKRISCKISELFAEEPIISITLGDRTRKLELVYTTVVKFIAWYNQQKQ